MSSPAPGRTAATDDYCVDCGHDHHPNHRGGRCWTDALGHPVERDTEQDRLYMSTVSAGR